MMKIRLIIFFLFFIAKLNAQEIDTIYHPSATEIAAVNQTTREIMLDTNNDTIKVFMTTLAPIPIEPEKVYYVKYISKRTGKISSEGKVILKRKRWFRKKKFIFIGKHIMYKVSGEIFCIDYYNNKGEILKTEYKY